MSPMEEHDVRSVIDEKIGPLVKSIGELHEIVTGGAHPNQGLWQRQENLTKDLNHHSQNLNPTTCLARKKTRPQV